MANYKSLMIELSDRLNTEVEPDLNNIVVLMIEKRVKIHIEADPMEEFITIGAFIVELPPGKFRENILKDALRANYQVNNNPGILSYMGKENTLALHMKFAIGSIDIDKLMDALKHITARSRKWQDAIESGKPSPDDEIPKSTGTSKRSIFGF